MLIYVERDDNETYMCFVSKKPHNTRSLVISFMEDDKPHDLITELEYAGWSEDNADLKPLVPLPPINGRLEINLHAKGTGFFGAWTLEESKMHLRKVRAVLKRYGIVGVPHRKLTIADMM